VVILPRLAHAFTPFLSLGGSVQTFFSVFLSVLVCDTIFSPHFGRPLPVLVRGISYSPPLSRPIWLVYIPLFRRDIPRSPPVVLSPRFFFQVCTVRSVLFFPSLFPLMPLFPAWASQLVPLGKLSHPTVFLWLFGFCLACS